MNRRRQTGWLLAFLALALVAGCSRGPESTSPTGPVTTSPDNRPDLLAAPRACLATPQGFYSETRLIRAASGGEVRQGRFTVTIPPGALASDTYITVRDRSYWYVSCELEPHGIQFQEAVTLQIDLRGLRWAPYTDWSIYWHGEDDTWVDQHGVFANGGVTAQLWHFSEYDPGRGRAGW